MGLYGFDIHEVFKGRAPLRLALNYIQRLSFEPWSEWRANKLGGPEHLGWTPDTYNQAALIDAINVNTAISGNVGSKKPPKKPDPAYRPKVIEETDEPEVEKVDSIAEFDINKLMMAMGG